MNQLSTKFRTPRPLYKRPRFWLVAGIAAVLAGAVAASLLTKTFPVLDATKEKTEKIDIKTEPDKATIKLDGKELKQKSNTAVRTKVGPHTITLSLDGYDTSPDIQVVLEAGKPYDLEHIFTKQGQTVLPSPKAGQAFLTTYTNAKFGYSLQYPATWSVDTDPSGVAHFYNDVATRKRQQSPNGEVEETLTILIADNPDNLSPEAFYKSRPEYSQEDQSQISRRSLTVAGQPAYQYDTPYGFVPYTITLLTGKGHAFSFQIKQGSADRKIYDQVLETFKLK